MEYRHDNDQIDPRDGERHENSLMLKLFIAFISMMIGLAALSLLFLESVNNGPGMSPWYFALIPVIILGLACGEGLLSEVANEPETSRDEP